jgi:hypothetical protein
MQEETILSFLLFLPRLKDNKNGAEEESCRNEDNLTN